MPFLAATGYQPLALGQWLSALRSLVTAAVPNAEVTDQRYLLARLLLVFSEELARGDNAFAYALTQASDPVQAEGYWLRLIAWRLGVPALPATVSRGLGEVTATPGTAFTGAEEAEDATTGRRWLVGPGTVGITGIAVLPIRCAVTGPHEPSTDPADWTIKTDLPAWTAFRATALSELGRDAEDEDALRERVLASLAEKPATEYGDVTAFMKLADSDGVSALLGYRTNRTDVTDPDGIPPHYFEAVFAQGLPAEQIGQAIRATASATAGTHGNRSITIEGPYGPLTYNYSVNEDMRVYARVTADTEGAPGEVPADLGAQLAAGLAAWSLTLGAGEVPTAEDGEGYLRGLFAKPRPFVDLEAEFSLDLVTWASYLTVTIRQTPRISNAPSPAQIVGVVPGPYVFAPGEILQVSTTGAPVSIIFAGTETSLDDVVSLIAGYAVADLTPDRTSDNASATLTLTTVSTGTAAAITLGPLTDPNVVAQLGLPAVPVTVNGRNTDVTTTILP